MASPIQQASLRRKLAYFGVILVIFSITLVWRGKISFASEGEEPAYTIASQTKNLELSELDQGEADLTGSTVRLMLTGSRGLAVCILWYSSIEKQKKGKWNEVELIVKSITKLQPRFIAPWLFQSWNISYNISVESERLDDMFYFISRGIKLAAEGEKVNKNSPDLRYWIGFYYQNKFGVSDKVNYLRSLMQLSCIPQNERNPDNFWKADDRSQVDMVAFEKFCTDHPQLVRRLREGFFRGRRPDSGDFFSCRMPADVIDFLQKNAKIPSRFDENSQLIDDRVKQFPVLPPYFLQEEPTSETVLRDTFDAFDAARAWFGYANQVVPPPKDVPSATEPLSAEERKKGYRIPRSPALIIFRQSPPRAQTYLAERLQKEGWITDTPWEVDRGTAEVWFPDKPLKLKSDLTSRQAWDKASRMWIKHGEDNRLRLSQNELENFRKQADRLLSMGIGPQSLATLSPEQMNDPSIREAVRAQNILVTYEQNLQMTNFKFYYFSSIAEMDEDTVKARELFFDARYLPRMGIADDKVLQKWDEAFNKWKRVLVKQRDFGRNQTVQEETYELVLDYVRFFKQRRGVKIDAAASLLVPNLPLGYQLEIPEPLTGLNDYGEEWIPDTVRDMIKIRRGIKQIPQPTPTEPLTPADPATGQ